MIYNDNNINGRIFLKVDGGWSAWSAWGKCSNNCGRGQETRTRTCTNPPPQNGGADCVGSGTESRDCIGCPGNIFTCNCFSSHVARVSKCRK